MTYFLGDVGKRDEPLRSGTVLSVTNGRAKVELATGAVIPSALLVGSASAGTRVRVAYRDGQYVVYGGGAAGAGGVSISASSSGGSALVGGTPSPHEWLGAHHTLPTGAAGLFAATPASSSGVVSMRAMALSDFQAAADTRYSLASTMITAGAGLTGGGQLGSAMTINVGVGDGIAADADLVRVLRATTSGLTFSGGGLAVGAGNGISVLTSSVAVNQAFAFSWTASHAFGAGLAATTGTFTNGLNVGAATGATNGRIASIGSNSGTASDYIGAQFDYTQSVGNASITAYAYRATARATHTSGVLNGLQSNSTIAEFTGAGGTTTNGEVLTSYAVVSSGASVNTLNMMKVFTPAVSGTVSTLVGLRISNMTGASSNWSIYTEGGAHYFTGATTQAGTLSVNAGINVGSATGADTGEVRANTLSLAGATQGTQGQIRTSAAYANSDFRGLAITNTGNAGLTLQTASISLLGVNESARLVGGNQNSGDGAPGFFAVWTRANSTTIEERLRVNSVGNVGIGIAAPVATASRFVHLSGVASELHLTSDSSGHGQNDGLSIQMWSDNIAYFVQRENAAMEFWTNNIRRAVIDSAGRLGIGNFPPSYSLDVVGDINSTGVYRRSGTQVVGARATGWAAPTGTATRTTFATGTVTTAQLAERVKALIDDLTTHGLIGA